MSKYNVPYEFNPGTRARASQVNANFDYLTKELENLDDMKANLSGDATLNFFVADPVKLQHAATKKYVDMAISSSGGGGGSGVGKSMFEVFTTMSSKTPPGAYSLRTGEVIEDAENAYPAFWNAVVEQGTGIIPDFSNMGALPEGYTASFDNIDSSIMDSSRIPKAFSPYSWMTVNGSPTYEKPFVAELSFSEAIKCDCFRVNSHVFNTYDSVGTADASKAIRSASIAVRQPDGNWVAVATINESAPPKTNSRYYESSMPELEFTAIRIVASANFGSDKTDISIYPIRFESSSVRIVSEEQWQWEVAHYGETGAFVVNEEVRSIRLPKVTRFIAGVLDLWEIGIPGTVSSGGMSLTYDEPNSELVVSDPKTSSMNYVSAGLWIQVYSAVSEESLANVVGIPHGQLFEEQLFRFVPKEESGWFVSDMSWRDGSWFVDAYTLLLNQYALAQEVADGSYKVAPNGMKFAPESLYASTYETYGETPYYVIDTENVRFKTPASNNYRRCSTTVDNVGVPVRDGAPNIIGTYATADLTDDAVAPAVSGAFYYYNSGYRDSHNGSGSGGKGIGLDASRCSSVYGRSQNEIVVRSSSYVLCVFLGNEVRQSSSVNFKIRLEDCEQNVSSIASEQSSIKSEIQELRSEISDSSRNYQLLIERLENAEARLSSNEENMSTLRTQLESIATLFSNLNDRVTYLENAASRIEFSIDDSTLIIDDNKGS